MYKVIGSRKIKSRQPQVTQKIPIAWGLWLYRIATLLFFITATYVLFFSSQLEITTLKISGLDKLSENSVRNAIKAEMNEKYFNLINADNLIIFRKNKLRSHLLNTFKYIEEVRIDKVFPHALELAIKERKLSMLLCGSAACYTLDNAGISYLATNFTKEELANENLLTLKETEPSQLGNEDKPLEDGYRIFVLNLAGAVWNESGIALGKNYETSNRMSGDVKVESADGWRIYFNESVGLKKSALTLRAVLEDKIEKERQKDLEYIDLRIANKIFYKFKDGTQNAVMDVPAILPEEKKPEDKKRR